MYKVASKFMATSPSISTLKSCNTSNEKDDPDNANSERVHPRNLKARHNSCSSLRLMILSTRSDHHRHQEEVGQPLQQAQLHA